MGNLSISGMSLRDYLAAQAMQGIISSGDRFMAINGSESSLSERAYQIADAMIKQREKTESK